MVKITDVEAASLASQCGILPGDVLLSINDNEINDVLDYRFYLTETAVKLALTRDGNEYSVTIKKDEYGDIGLDFETPLMDKKHTCKNSCIFCFIDQNPEGLRESLYFKDDDSRLSFLHGNYITLTNMSDKDVERIVKMRFSPINISVHTTNPELRVKMMKNKRSGDVLKYLADFKRAGLQMCAQIVLCKGVNDGDELVRSMRDLAEYAPELNSLAIVPAGLTKFRDGLYPLADFTSEEASEIIDQVNGFGDECCERFGMRLVYAADEFYIKAGREIPDADYYEDYSQLENGVGMIRSFTDEVDDALTDADQLVSSLEGRREVSVITGAASYSLMNNVANRIEALTDKIKINVFEIKNYFFGESITVSGLLTGKDIYEQIKDKQLGDSLILPANCLRDGEDVFLCGMTLDALSEKLDIDIRVAENDGYDFVDAIFGIERW